MNRYSKFHIQYGNEITGDSTHPHSMPRSPQTGPEGRGMGCWWVNPLWVYFSIGQRVLDFVYKHVCYVRKCLFYICVHILSIYICIYIYNRATGLGDTPVPRASPWEVWGSRALRGGWEASAGRGWFWEGPQGVPRVGFEFQNKQKSSQKRSTEVSTIDFVCILLQKARQ